MVGASGCAIWKINKELEKTIQEISQQLIIKHKTEALTPEIDTSQWKVYKNEKYGFEFKYPKEWIIKSYNSNHTYVLFSEQWRGKFKHPFIEINIKPNPKKLTIREFYNGTNDINLFTRSNNKYFTGKLGEKIYYKFIPYVTFAGEVIVIIPLEEVFLEVIDNGSAFQENGIFEAILSSFKFFYSEDDKD